MIFVTGGTGLVGSHLIYNLLMKGEKVRALARKSSNTEAVVNDLNVKIQDIDIKTDEFISENYRSLVYGVPPRQKIDSFLIELNTGYNIDNNDFLNSYLKYKNAHLKYLSRYNSSQEIARMYYFSSPVLYNNVSYMGLFKEVFKNFFKSFSDKKQGESYVRLVNQEAKLSLIENAIATNLNITNDTLIELLILKGIYDGFHNGDLYSTYTIPLLDSLIKSPSSKEV